MTIKNFDDCFDILIGHEGKYSNHPNDPGGETMYGITEIVARAHGYTGEMKDLPLAKAKEIAKLAYWDLYQCDLFDVRLGFQIFDITYNGGYPIKWIQQSLGLTVDGVLGPKTLSAILSYDPIMLILKLNSARLSYYTSLKTWSTFGKGWTNRVARNLIIAAS